MTDLDRSLEGMPLEVGNVEPVELTPEEQEENVKDIFLSSEQFGFIGYTLRNRVTSAVGESMQYIEISALPREAQEALKASVKRSIWLAVRDTLRSIADVSGLDGKDDHMVIYGKEHA